MLKLMVEPRGPVFPGCRRSISAAVSEMEQHPDTEDQQSKKEWPCYATVAGNPIAVRAGRQRNGTEHVVLVPQTGYFNRRNPLVWAYPRKESSASVNLHLGNGLTARGPVIRTTDKQ
jgi:hypothetical protein